MPLMDGGAQLLEASLPIRARALAEVREVLVLAVHLRAQSLQANLMLF
eukprot:CAMPEP_0183452294 /NCGR_PEP_ID=MMETSP0370-20130417/117477_1 /TAXON_ID=268820 /ORGANISM="Peridinium aciculiferum, Strain PAER-2" /LENGTH=47 /DNA_ID= /DNA_START= /DNA_END= /DNA_ORIENTATION=